MYKRQLSQVMRPLTGFEVLGVRLTAHQAPRNPLEVSSPATARMCDLPVRSFPRFAPPLVPTIRHFCEWTCVDARERYRLGRCAEYRQPPVSLNFTSMPSTSERRREARQREARRGEARHHRAGKGRRVWGGGLVWGAVVVYSTALTAISQTHEQHQAGMI